MQLARCCLVTCLRPVQYLPSVFRLRTPGSAKLFAGFLRLQLGTVAKSLLRGTRPTGVRQFLTLLSGAAQSVPHAIDHDQQVYVTEPS